MQIQEVDELFDDTWHRLDAQVEAAKQKAKKAAAEPEPEPRKAEDMLAEALLLLRRIDRNQPVRRRVQVGDVGTLPDGRSAFVASEAEATKINLAFDLAERGFDISGIPVLAIPTLQTVRAKASVGGAAVTTSSATGSLEESPPAAGSEAEGENG